MKIDASDKEIQDIFSLGYFRIPRFQRPYSWERDEVENFWDDVVLDQGSDYFIGSMVVYQQNKPYFGIVDGQQRLTTITLMLAAIRNEFAAIGEDNLARGVHKYVEQPNIDNQQEFVLNSETSFPYLQAHIQSFDGYKFQCDVGVEEQNLMAAFQIISDRLQAKIGKSNSVDGQLSLFSEKVAVGTLKSLRDKILSLKLVFIQLDNEQDAYLIFETLNARGRDLNTSDLVKSLLLKKIRATSATLDSAKESWNALVKSFDDISETGVLDTFLLHYWISAHAYTTDKKLYSEISRFVGDDDQKAAGLLRLLSDSANIYRVQINPVGHFWSKEEFDIKKTLIAFRLFKVKQQSSMVLSILRAYYKKIITLRVAKVALRKIEYFHFVFNAVTSQRSSGSIATIYSSHAIRLSNAKSNDECQIIFSSLFLALSDKLPNYEEFEVKFCEFEYLSNITKYKNVIKYALSLLYGNTICGLDINHDSLTIEHLIPESSIKNGVSASIVANIGNLILVDEKTNSNDLRDKSPVEKIKNLKSCGYPLELVGVCSDDWSELDIKNRAKFVALSLYKSMKIK
ncbi:DUF262 domain-containing protein [Azonexus sp.]|uniref:DUF262 domain-containing protein n=1 Tax=Azonexus sp. TaxID=1872668 RepID=UPI0027B947DB|nr:DUF262 domain-containing protein [Azonexus sp.]